MAAALLWATRSRWHRVRFLVNASAEEGEAPINVITHWQKTISDRKIP